MVFICNGKTTCFGLWRPSSGFDNFLAIRVIYNMHKTRRDVEINTIYIYIYIYTNPMCILYIIPIARKLSKPEDGRYRPKHVVIPLPINTII